VVNEDECNAAGLNKKEVASIARGLNRYAIRAKRLGITVFGGTGFGSLRYRDSNEKGTLILAELKGDFDGGDGGSHIDDDGLERSE